MPSHETDASDLEDVKKLLILGLIRSGLSQTQVAAALDMHRTSLSRMFPKGLLADVAKKGKLEPNGVPDGE